MWAVNVGSLKLVDISSILPIFSSRVPKRPQMACYRVAFASRFYLNRAGMDLRPLYPPNSQLHLSRGPVEVVEIFQLDFRPKFYAVGKVVSGHLIVCAQDGRWGVHFFGK